MCETDTEALCRREANKLTIKQKRLCETDGDTLAKKQKRMCETENEALCRREANKLTMKQNVCVKLKLKLKHCVEERQIN